MSETPASASILLADDDPGVLAAFAFALRAAGHRVEEAGDGTRAVEALGRGPYDLLFLDVLMPGATGWEVLAHAVDGLAPGSVRPRVIFMTGFHQEYVVDIQALKREGVATILMKPIPTSDLLEETARVLAGPAPRTPIRTTQRIVP